MSWIQTYSGRQFFPTEPRVEDVSVEDIAHSLSLQCRFNGHCRCFYSVAEHSVRVADALPEELRLWGLLHDAPEAYLADLPRPLKLLLPEYVRAEERLLKEIAKKFSLSWPMPDRVREADDRLLATEARDLMASPPAPWHVTAEPLSDIIVPWSPEQAEAIFLERLLG